MAAHFNPFRETHHHTEPDCQVSPRCLAGPNGSIGHIVAELRKEGWETFADFRDTDHFCNPGHEVCVAYSPLELVALPGILGAGRRLWHLWGRPADYGVATWHATMTTLCPPELIGGAVKAMNRKQDEPALEGQAERTLRPLAEAGWTYGTTGAATRYASRDGLVSVSYIPTDYTGREPSTFALNAAWRAETRHPQDEALLWTADFGATTPLRVVAAFMAALACETPLPRGADDLDPSIRPHLRLS
jgi:hypothetical protein